MYDVPGTLYIRPWILYNVTGKIIMVPNTLYTVTVLYTVTGTIYCIHYILSHYTLCTVNSSWNTVHCVWLYTFKGQCTVYLENSTLNLLHQLLCTLYNVPGRTSPVLYLVHWIMFTVPGALYLVHLSGTPCTLLFTLLSVPVTLSLVPCT